ncbi:transposon protein, putative, CACTA, En/Spm sub-class [Panicum miliaceum]|uniref:Transposon protein, putative, CACTA, En/Spm sub-class n=1 Tax=Panicum miliaceum TaxID=4540 RepID=A0A3L6QIJ6_PANMI|nr:transposon protein, putative, CACTA, En/Spm sub-class [Panicum miliaceum]
MASAFLAKELSEQPLDYRRPYKQLPREFSSLIEKKMILFMPLRIQNIQIRGKGVIPWKYGFRQYIDSYRSRQKRKNEEQARLRMLEEQLLSNGARMVDEVKRQVAIAMSQ